AARWRGRRAARAASRGGGGGGGGGGAPRDPPRSVEDVTRRSTRRTTEVDRAARACCTPMPAPAAGREAARSGGAPVRPPRGEEQESQCHSAEDAALDSLQQPEPARRLVHGMVEAGAVDCEAARVEDLRVVGRRANARAAVD